MFADQFQRNGVILDRRLGVRIGDTRALSRGGSRGFSDIFEIVAADEAGGSAEKGDPPARRHRLPRPSLALRHPCCPIYPRHPIPAQREGARDRCSTSCRPTDHSTPSWERVRPACASGRTPRRPCQSVPVPRLRNRITFVRDGAPPPASRSAFENRPQALVRTIVGPPAMV
jgi:hypothetical protein